MLWVLVFFGAGAVTLFLAETLSKEAKKGGCGTLVEWFAYAVLDQFLALVVLLPTNKAAIFTAENGTQTIQFWILGYGVFLAVAVVMGLIAAICKKKLKITVEIEQKERVMTDEKEESSQDLADRI